MADMNDGNPLTSWLTTMKDWPARTLLALAIGCLVLLGMHFTPWFDLGFLFVIVAVFMVLSFATAFGSLWQESHESGSHHRNQLKYEKQRDEKFATLRSKLTALPKSSQEILRKCYRDRTTTISVPEDYPGIIALHKAGFVEFWETRYDPQHRARTGRYFLNDEVAEHIRQRDYFGEALGADS